ncbi:MAG: MATE family efflux transporter [Lachnospiraceae bacterium]|jgi:putative MATE family efflux protein|nr:MATE family efflux transporter [Lachnospiraceae bacterium]
MKDLTKGSPLKAILLFALPIYIGQLFQLCYSIIDTRIIGATLGGTSLAAVGATISLSDMLIEFINGIVCGFGIIVARFTGARAEDRMKKAVGGTFVLGTAITALISILCLCFLRPMLRLLNVSDGLMPEASSYIGIIIAGLMATTLYNCCAAVLRAIGDSYTPLIFLIISNALNVGMDYLFILGFHLGVGGAALATVAAQAVSAVICLLYMRKKYSQLVLRRQDLVPDREICRQLLPTGLSMGFMISFVTLGSLALQTCINTFGNSIIVAHTAARKLTTVFLTPFFVLGTALATYCGQNLGAREYGRIRKGIRDAILFSLGWCLIVIVLVYTLSGPMVSAITASRDSEVLKMATLYLKVNSVLYFLPAVICILRNSMQGFGDTKTPLVSSLIELTGKVLIACFLAPAIGYMGVIISEPIVWSVMIIPLLVSFKGKKEG